MVQGVLHNTSHCCEFLLVQVQVRTEQKTLLAQRSMWFAVQGKLFDTSPLCCCVMLHAQVRTKQLDIAGAEEQVARLEGLLKEAKGATDKVQKEFNALSEKVSKAGQVHICAEPACVMKHG
jgi:F0F1-type ATP synthase epsilon subunit